MRALLPMSAAALIGSLFAIAASNKPAELNLTDLDGRKVRLKDYRGKNVVLNFWATWCGPCKEEMPVLVRAEKEWSAKGIVFIGASLDERASQKNIPDFLKSFDVGYSVWKGASADDLHRLGLGDAVPATVFIDEEGNIAARVLGEIKKAELTERLEWIAGGRKGPAPQPFLRNL